MGTNTLNAIKYKISRNEYLDGYDILSLCILPTFKNIKSEKEVIEEIIELSADINTNDFLREVFTTSMVNWIFNIFDDEDKINELIGVLNMTKCVTFNDMIEFAIYAKFEKAFKRQEEAYKKQEEELNNLNNTIHLKDERIKELENQLKQK